jgi:4'-phosphopantetheinyl transferase
MTRREQAPAAGVVAVWRLDLAGGDAAALADSLSADERARAARFRFPRDRDRFVAARAGLRQILGACLGLEARAVRFAYGARGKPALAGGELSFNLSHADDLALVAVAREAPVGVDVERLRAVAGRERIAARCFAPAERAALGALPEEARDLAFLLGWTRKEAVAKARGEGVAALTAIAVELDPTRPARLVALDGDEAAAARWSLHPLEPAPGYLGAVAVTCAARLDDRGEWAPAAGALSPG